MSRLVPILALLLLAGCANQLPWSDPQPKADGAVADDAKCRSYGLQPGTPEFEKCLTKLADQRAQADYNERAALSGRLQNRPPPGFDTGIPTH